MIRYSDKVYTDNGLKGFPHAQTVWDPLDPSIPDGEGMVVTDTAPQGEFIDAYFTSNHTKINTGGTFQNDANVLLPLAGGIHAATAGLENDTANPTPEVGMAAYAVPFAYYDLNDFASAAAIAAGKPLAGLPATATLAPNTTQKFDLGNINPDDYLLGPVIN